MEIEDFYMIQVKSLRGAMSGVSNIMGTKITIRFRKVNGHPVHQLIIESQGEITVLYFSAMGSGPQERMNLITTIINLFGKYLRSMEEYWGIVETFIEEGQDEELLKEFIQQEEDIEKIFSEIKGGDRG